MMQCQIPFVPITIILQRRPLKPLRLKLWVLMLFVAAAAITIAVAVTIYRRWPPSPVSATSANPEAAVRQEKVVHGVRWGMSYEAAFEQAVSDDMPVLIYFAAVNDANSRLMERTILPRADIVPLLSEFVTVQLYDDRVPISSISAPTQQALAEANAKLHSTLGGRPVSPSFIALGPTGEVPVSVPLRGVLKISREVISGPFVEFGFQ
jgi:hypothetical protein